MPQAMTTGGVKRGQLVVGIDQRIDWSGDVSIYGMKEVHRLG